MADRRRTFSLRGRPERHCDHVLRERRQLCHRSVRLRRHFAPRGFNLLLLPHLHFGRQGRRADDRAFQLADPPTNVLIASAKTATTALTATAEAEAHPHRFELLANALELRLHRRWKRL